MIGNAQLAAAGGDRASSAGRVRRRPVAAPAAGAPRRSAAAPTAEPTPTEPAPSARGAARRARRARRPRRGEDRGAPPDPAAAHPGAAGLEGPAQPRPHPPPRVRRATRARARPRSPGSSPGSTAPSACCRRATSSSATAPSWSPGYVGQTALKTAEVIERRARRRAVHRRGLRARRRRLRQRGDRHAGQGDGGPPRRAARDRRRVPGADGDVHRLEPRAREPVPAHAGRSTTTATTSWSRSSRRIADGCRLHARPRRVRPCCAAIARGRRRATRGSATAASCATLFESAIVRQAWRLRDVTDPDVDQLRELPRRGSRRDPDELTRADATRPTRRPRTRRCHHHDQSRDHATAPAAAHDARPDAVGGPPPAPPGGAHRPHARPGARAVRRRGVGHARAHARPRRDRHRREPRVRRVRVPRRCCGSTPTSTTPARNAEQLVRIQTIRTNLVKADANATNAFLVGGLEPPAVRDAYADGIATTARTLAEASAARSDDATALERVNRVLTEYTGLIEAARANNRQGFPVGAAYLRQASRVLRDDALPTLATLVQVEQRRVRGLDRGRRPRAGRAAPPARARPGRARRRAGVPLDEDAADLQQAARSPRPRSSWSPALVGLGVVAWSRARPTTPARRPLPADRRARHRPHRRVRREERRGAHADRPGLRRAVRGAVHEHRRRGVGRHRSRPARRRPRQRRGRRPRASTPYLVRSTGSCAPSTTAASTTQAVAAATGDGAANQAFAEFERASSAARSTTQARDLVRRPRPGGRHPLVPVAWLLLLAGIAAAGCRGGASTERLREYR